MKKRDPERGTALIFGTFLGVGALFLVLAAAFYFILRNTAFAGTGLFCLIFALVGLVFFLMGGIALLALSSARRRRERLWAAGRRIDATVIAVEINRNMQYGYQNPWRIVCREEGGDGRLFRSPNLWRNPEEFLRPGDTISVYLDPDNPRRYAVDTRLLSDKEAPPMGPEIR